MEERITTLEGRLLYFIYSLANRQLITPHERAALKDMLLSDHRLIYLAFQKYEREGTGLTLTADLRSLLQARRRASEDTNGGSNPGSRIRRALSVKIPERSIQKLPHIDDRI